MSKETAFKAKVANMLYTGYFSDPGAETVADYIDVLYEIYKPQLEQASLEEVIYHMPDEDFIMEYHNGFEPKYKTNNLTRALNNIKHLLRGAEYAFELKGIDRKDLVETEHKLIDIISKEI